MYVLKSRNKRILKGKLTTIYAGFLLDRGKYRQVVDPQDAFLYEDKDLTDMDSCWIKVHAEYDSEGVVREMHAKT
jgi:hypothetical protein